MLNFNNIRKKRFYLYILIFFSLNLKYRKTIRINELTETEQLLADINIKEYDNDNLFY
jgi:hypothetical protein